MLQKGLKGIVLKRGAEGAYVAVAGGKAAWVKAFQVKAVDTVGAGDCFNGAFAVALLEGQRSMGRRAIRLGRRGHLGHPARRSSLHALARRSREVSCRTGLGAWLHKWLAAIVKHASGAKAPYSCASCGTTKVVPFQKSDLWNQF